MTLKFQKYGINFTPGSSHVFPSNRRCGIHLIDSQRTNFPFHPVQTQSQENCQSNPRKYFPKKKTNVRGWVEFYFEKVEKVDREWLSINQIRLLTELGKRSPLPREGRARPWICNVRGGRKGGNERIVSKEKSGKLLSGMGPPFFSRLGKYTVWFGRSSLLAEELVLLRKRGRWREIFRRRRRRRVVTAEGWRGWLISARERDRQKATRHRLEVPFVKGWRDGVLPCTLASRSSLLAFSFSSRRRSARKPADFWRTTRGETQRNARGWLSGGFGKKGRCQRGICPSVQSSNREDLNTTTTNDCKLRISNSLENGETLQRSETYEILCTHFTKNLLFKITAVFVSVKYLAKVINWSFWPLLVVSALTKLRVTKDRLKWLIETSGKNETVSIPVRRANEEALD